MAPRSSIETDPRIKEAADEAIRRGSTVDMVLEALLALGADVSRSAVGRYTKKARGAMERYREAQEVAKVWVDKFGADPNGDVSQLLPHMLRAVAFNQISIMGDETPGTDDGPTSRDTALLAGAIKDLASAEKITAERILKVRKETAAKAADEAVKVAKAGGMNADTIAKLRAAVIGTAA
ncbi:MAG: DUF3486 family protein [Reyranella sp.]|nr:DUF3486 family protein [Reyranella sp.]